MYRTPLWFVHKLHYDISHHNISLELVNTNVTAINGIVTGIKLHAQADSEISQLKLQSLVYSNCFMVDRQLSRTNL